jgi:hypothetical protein
VLSRSARRWRTAVVLGIVVGALAAGAMVAIARLHNAADAARAPGYVEWGGLAILAVGWFLPSALVATLVARLLLGAAGRGRDRGEQPDAPTR